MCRRAAEIPLGATELMLRYVAILVFCGAPLLRTATRAGRIILRSCRGQPIRTNQEQTMATHEKRIYLQHGDAIRIVPLHLPDAVKPPPPDAVPAAPPPPPQHT